MISHHGPLSVVQLPCLTDNYAFLVRDETRGVTAAIDTPDADAIAAALDAQGWGLDYILNTHWHADHTGGNDALKARFGAVVVGPGAEGDRIPGRDRMVGEGDMVTLGSQSARVIETPGHTRGHICYLFDAQKVGFVGDTLFSLGCGRLFEGDAAQMWASLRRLRDLPGHWTLYCAHEYTAANARFAESLGPVPDALAARIADVRALRDRGAPTVPMSLEEERRTNPFLRADDPALAAAVGHSGQPEAEVFAEVRRRKDTFRG